MTSKRHPYTNAIAAVALSLSAILVGASPTPVDAQQRVNIQFQPGATNAEFGGAIRGQEYIDYVLNARAGQTMVVNLSVTDTNGFGSVFYNILPAGQDFPVLHNGSTDDDRRAEVTLPSGGNWAIRVYQMGNDADTGKTSGFSINVFIRPGGSTGGGSSAGAGMLPEEDFFVVNLSGGGVLNVRQAPRASALKIGEFRNGTVLRNVGGCTMSNGRQWCNVQASSGGVSGWVAARFLALPGPGGAGSESTGTADDGGGAMGGAPAVARVIGVPANDVLNVRSGPGTGSRIVGALANGDRVRTLGCQDIENSRWCEIEMMTEMRERGWVNARYLQ